MGNFLFRMIRPLGHPQLAAASLLPMDSSLRAAVSMQSNPHSRMNGRSPNGVGLALVATPHVSVEKRRVGERRPYTLLHRYGSE
ncbi:MAG: hypothetical protein HY736_14875 [Verrucomicrobia bacterium]|nr:hypothetical protein [Verrucomicrobiota bacterium]